MEKCMPTKTPQKSLKIDVIKNAFKDVIHSYVWFLRQISRLIFDKRREDLEREKMKFDTNKAEFLDFLFEHKKFYKLKSIQVKPAGDVIFCLNINCLDNCENILKLEDVSKVYNEDKKDPESMFLWRIPRRSNS